MIAQSRAFAAVRDGLVIVLAGLGASFVLTGVASVAYRPRGHVGSLLDWLRVAAYLVAMAVGAPLRVHSGADHGQVRLVPLTVTAVLVAVAVQRGRTAASTAICAAIAAVTAAGAVGLLCLLSGARLRSYGHSLRPHYSAPALTAALGAVVVVGLAYAMAGRLRGAWARAAAGALAGAAVLAAVASLTTIGVAVWKLPPSTLGAMPGLLGDGAAWFGGFSLGGRLTADLSSPIPFLSGNLGSGLITGGAWPAAYGLLVVPLLAAVVAGRRQQRAVPPGAQPWAEFGRAVAVNAALWATLAEASRLRFSGHLGADVLSGSAGLDLATTVFVAALWGGVSAVAGLALSPRTS